MDDLFFKVYHWLKIGLLVAVVLFLAYFGLGLDKKPKAVSKTIDPKLEQLIRENAFPDNRLMYFRGSEKNISLELYELACKHSELHSDEIQSHKYGYGIFSELYSTGAAQIRDTARGGLTAEFVSRLLRFQELFAVRSM